MIKQTKAQSTAGVIGFFVVVGLILFLLIKLFVGMVKAW